MESSNTQTPEEEKVAQPVASAARGKHTIAAHAVLVRPVITEKALLLQAQRKYVFEVAMHATKISVKKAVHNAFGVMPISVQMAIREGKKVQRGRTTGMRKDTKRAIVTLKEGQAI